MIGNDASNRAHNPNIQTFKYNQLQTILKNNPTHLVKFYDDQKLNIDAAQALGPAVDAKLITNNLFQQFKKSIGITGAW